MSTPGTLTIITMPSNAVPDHYYALLEIDQDTDLDAMKKAYKNMASKLHPDRSSRHDTTRTFS
jgi:DnaJ-class molecular chaperone